MAKHGSKKLETTGAPNHSCISRNTFLTPQIIAEDWHITFTHNHWANESTVKDYISKIIVPYVENKKES